MFHQVSPTVSWTSYSDAKTMVNVGTDAVALLYQNIIVFHNVKTKGKSYFKGDSAETTFGISLLAGHNVFPYFAVIDAVLRPSIYIFKYPEMEKLTIIPPDDVTEYISLEISDHGYLAALSGAPNYTLRLWNYRTGVHYADVNTPMKCDRYCLHLTTSSEALVLQYSIWERRILVWELCNTMDQYTIYEISNIQLGEDFEKSTLYHITYSEDGNAYVVNDYGNVFSVNLSHFSLKSEWTPPKQHLEKCAFKLFRNKSGLLVVDLSSIYCIKRRQNEWIIDWHIENIDCEIQKIVTDNNNVIYAATNLGNVFYVDHVGDTGDLRELYTQNFAVLDFCVLRNLKEEAVLFLTTAGEIRLVDCMRMNLFSSHYVKNACSLGVHNSLPAIAVGTTTGQVHFILFEKSRTPIELAVLEIADHLKITHVRICDGTTFVKDKLNGMHIMQSNFKLNKFSNLISLEPEKNHILRILDLFLLDNYHALSYVSQDHNKYTPYAKEAWLYSWTSENLGVKCQVFALPYKYCKVTLIETLNPNNFEFAAVRLNKFFFDVLRLFKSCEINIIYSIETNHLGTMHCINGSRSLLTSGPQSIFYHFYSHKRSKAAHLTSRVLLTTFIPRVRRKMEECYNSKFLIVFTDEGYLLTFRLPALVDNLVENKSNEDFYVTLITPRAVILKDPKEISEIVIPEVTKKDIKIQETLKYDLSILANNISELIDYDISVTGQSHGVYRKFCLNSQWLQILTDEARALCGKENNALLAAIDEQSRIRDWILSLIRNERTRFGYKLRSIFSHINMENFSTCDAGQEIQNKLDYFRFYDLNFEREALEDEGSVTLTIEAGEPAVNTHGHFAIQGVSSVYEHVMSKEFDMQDTRIVSFNQLYNEDAKLETIIIDALKQEFNKEFLGAKAYKEEVVDLVLNMNGELRKIYANMNCMLCLLKMEKFEPPAQSKPEWTKDEDLKRILTVDDSEVVAINRRRKIVESAAYKSGRMLLWPIEYWVRAIMMMMDGVLEKLWEDEIKKTPPPPDFVHRKQVHEYTLEDQKLLAEYQKKLGLLDEDRQKYLRILKDNEVKTLSRKKNFIIKLNQKLAETAILKLKYDFAVKHERLRLINTKVMHFKRIACRKLIHSQRQKIDKLVGYVGKYSKLLEYWERTFNEIKTKLETQTFRDKQIERQFKGQYMSTIPAHLTHELNKIYKRRPKIPVKAFNTSNVCFDAAERIVSKKHQKFSLTLELIEFLGTIDAADDAQNCPNQLDQKHFENFIKIRRQKLESELRLKGIGFQLLDAQNKMNFYTRELNTVKIVRTETGNMLMETMEDYFDTTQNQTLEIVLELGQVELSLKKSLFSFQNSLLMHVDDINDANKMIREAGRRKLNAMQRVAFFRRQVIYKEWEHKVVRANIQYLEYVLKLVEKCKVTHEFLEVLRDWHKLKENKVLVSKLGSIEHTIEQKIEGRRERLKVICADIDRTKHEIFSVKKAGRNTHKKIDELKTNVTMLSASRDILSEEKLVRERNERLTKLKAHRNLIDTVRRHYIQIMELTTILELQRLRTYPTLGPAPQCAFSD